MNGRKSVVEEREDARDYVKILCRDEAVRLWLIVRSYRDLAKPRDG